MSSAAQSVSSSVSSSPTTVHTLLRFAGPSALIAGFVLAAAGMTLHVRGGAPDEDFVRTVAAHSSQWLASHLLMGLGWMLVALGVTTAARMVHGRGAVLTGIGIGVVFVGAVLMSLGDVAHGAVAYALVDRVDASTSVAIQEAFFANPAILVISSGGMLLPLGILVLAAGVLRSGAVPRWAAVTLLFSPLFVQLGYSTDLPFVLLVIPLVVGMAALAHAVAHAPSAQPDSLLAA